MVAHWTSIGPDSNVPSETRSKGLFGSGPDAEAENESSLEWHTDPVEWERFLPHNRSCDYADSIGVPWRHLWEYADSDHGFVKCQSSAIGEFSATVSTKKAGWLTILHSHIEAKYMLSSWLKQEEQYDDDLLLSWSKLEKHRNDNSCDCEIEAFGDASRHRKAIRLNTFKHIVDTLHHRGRLIFLEQKDADAGYMHIQVCHYR